MGDDGHSRRQTRSSRNSENSLLQSLKTDWQMFWQGLVGDDEAEAEPDAFVTGRLEALSSDQLRELTRVLSHDRKKLNQKLESIQKEIDLNSVKLESLRLVGGDVEEVVQRLNTLSDLGHNMSQELTRLNEKLKLARRSEDRLRKGLA
jgi:hypothetical protein